MLTDWLRVAERIAVALERMADAAEARNRLDWIPSPPHQVEVINGSQRDG